MAKHYLTSYKTTKPCWTSSNFIKPWGWCQFLVSQTRLEWLAMSMSIQKALMVFKSLNGLAPEYLTSKFLSRNESNYALRESVNKLVVPLLLLFSRTAAQNFGPAYLLTLESRHSKKGFNFRLFIYICIWRALPTRTSHTSRATGETAYPTCIHCWGL